MDLRRSGRLNGQTTDTVINPTSPPPRNSATRDAEDAAARVIKDGDEGKG
jgi:hypothetical protein